MKELESRLRSRGTDSEESIQKRMQNARDEMTAAAQFDIQLVNDDLDATYEKLSALVKDALQRKALNG